MVNDPANESKFSASQAMYAATRLIIERLAYQGAKPLGTISSPIGGGTPSRSNSNYFNGNIPWITVADLKLRQYAPQLIVTAREFITEDALEHSAAHLLPAGSVVLATRVSVGKVGIAQIPLATNQDFTSFMPRPGLNNRFLAYCLIASASKMQEATRGTTIKGIKRDQLLHLELPFPDEIAQENIVRYLDAVSEKGALYAADTASKKLPKIIQNVPKAVARIEELAARIEEARELRRQAVEETDALIAAKISQIFSKYKNDLSKIGQLGDYVVDDCYGTSEKTTDDSSGTSVLRMGNIQNGCLNVRDLKYLHIIEKDRKKLILKKGDILVNRTNSAELVGKCAVFDLEDEYSFASYLIRLRLDHERADSRLIASYINSPAGRAYMFSERKQMTGQANVNAKKLKALPISLPPLHEQRRIVAYLDGLQSKMDALKRHQAQTAAELDALLPAILERAFRGEL